MKFATWNVNSLNVRLNHVLDWLEENPVDILCLQELKQTDDKFPAEQIAEAGYKSVWAGQKTYNGVAILSRSEIYASTRNIPGFDDPQQRLITATIKSKLDEEIRVISAYCPNGQSVGSDKYEYKLAWYKALTVFLESELEKHSNLLILGDYNVAPNDEDVHDPEAWKDSVLVSKQERAAFQKLLDLGLTDSFRLFEQEPKSYSWWDYRRLSFRRNAGLRIDHILASTALAKKCTACFIDKTPRGWEKPSDHTPVVAEYDI